MNRHKTRFLFIFGTILGIPFGSPAIPTASANTIDAFGLSNSSIGQAVLSYDATARKLTVNNLGSSGQDGVSADLRSYTAGRFALDIAIDEPGVQVNGAYMQTTTYGSLGQGTTGPVSTLRTTQLATDNFQTTTDFSPDWNGDPLTVEYRTGGPNGQVVLTEPYGGSSPELFMANSPRTYYIDVGFDPPMWSAGIDGGIGGFGAMTSARGTPLPASDNIDFVDFLAPSSVSPVISSASLTAGGGTMSSFTISGEAVAVPEPSTFVIGGLGMIGFIGMMIRRNGPSKNSATINR